MEAKDCKRFDRCNANLCPMDSKSLEEGTWMPDEEICTLREYCQTDWIRNQKKIARKTRDFDSYYTVRMLEQNCIVGKGISGVDPDHDYADREKDVVKWLKAHPEKPKMSKEKKERLRNLMAEVNRELNPAKKESNRLEDLNSDRESA
jgi:hypothetical protein